MFVKSGKILLSLLFTLSFAAAQDNAADADAAFESAIAAMKKDAEAGDAHAAQQVYMRYAIKGDYEQARRWAETYRNLLTKKAEEGDTKAMLVLGTDYLTGKDYTPPDTEKALEWLQRAGAAGEPSAEFIRGELLDRKGKKEESAQAYAHAFALYTDALGKSPQDATLRYWVGYMQLCGTGTEQNTEAALTLLTPLAEEGHNWACSLLYKTYAEGTLLPRDEAKALGFAARSADSSGDGLMAYAVAAAYLQGKVLPKDETKGDHYLDIAAKANVPNAIYAKAQRLLQKKSLPMPPATCAKPLPWAMWQQPSSWGISSSPGLRGWRRTRHRLSPCFNMRPRVTILLRRPCVWRVIMMSTARTLSPAPGSR